MGAWLASVDEKALQTRHVDTLRSLAWLDIADADLHDSACL